MLPAKKVLVLVLFSIICSSVVLGSVVRGRKSKASSHSPKVAKNETNAASAASTRSILKNSTSEPRKQAVAGVAEKSARVKASDSRTKAKAAPQYGRQPVFTTPKKRSRTTTPPMRRRRKTTPLAYDEDYQLIPLRRRNKKKKQQPPPGMMVVFAPMPPKRPIFLDKLTTPSRPFPDWNYPSPEQPDWAWDMWNMTTPYPYWNDPYNYSSPADNYLFWTTYYPNYNWSTFYSPYYQENYNNYSTENYYYYNNYTQYYQENYYNNYSTENYYNYTQYYGQSFPTNGYDQNYTAWPQYYNQQNFTSIFPNYNWTAVYVNYSTYHPSNWSMFGYQNYSTYSYL